MKLVCEIVLKKSFLPAIPSFSHRPNALKKGLFNTLRLFISSNFPNIAVMNESTIHISNLTIGYRTKGKSKIVAEHLNADIRSGELTCLLGVNGVGKSTLLKTLSAFLPPLDGEIYLMGHGIATYSAPKLSQTISIVLTERCNIRNLSAYELVGLGRNPYTGFWGKLTRHDHDVITDALRQVGILHLKDRSMDMMSDGERQKAMIAKALAQETPIIFLDEPTAFLDFPSKVEIMQLLHHLSRHKGKTIFLSTHDQELALQMADRLWLLGKGGILKTGIPEDLALNGTLSNFFANDHIIFDRTSGLFRIENTPTQQICLKGDGTPYAMIRKALQRYGIDADRRFTSDVSIEIDPISPNPYILRHKDGSATPAFNIEQLLLNLQNATLNHQVQR